MKYKKKYFAAFLAGLFLGGSLLSGCGEESASKGVSTPAAQLPAAAKDAPLGEARAVRGADVKYEVPERVSVFMYHMVGDIPDNAAVITEENFRRQMQYLKDNGWHPITMQELEDYVTKGAPLPEKPVCITFDDGYEDNYKIVYPLMKEYGFPWTVFVITGSVGQPGRMTWEELREMAESRTVTIANHTVTHPHLTALSAEDREKEILWAKWALKEKLGVDSPWIAYPYGDYDADVIEICRRAKLRLGIVMESGRVKTGDAPFELRRVWIGNAVDTAHFEERLTRDDYSSL